MRWKLSRSATCAEEVTGNNAAFHCSLTCHAGESFNTSLETALCGKSIQQLSDGDNNMELAGPCNDWKQLFMTQNYLLQKSMWLGLKKGLFSTKSQRKSNCMEKRPSP